MHKPKQVMDTTDDNRVYKRARKFHLENEGEINCAFCPYHRIENWSRKPKKKGRKDIGKRRKAYRKVRQMKERNFHNQIEREYFEDGVWDDFFFIDANCDY